jgi:two-component system sensor histidine kinase AlgZ
MPNRDPLLDFPIEPTQPLVRPAPGQSSVEISTHLPAEARAGGGAPISSLMSERPGDAERRGPARPAAWGWFGGAGTPVVRAVKLAQSAFDVCHVGVVMRAILFVHATVVLGLLFTSTSWRSWLTDGAVAAAITLPATLAWLVVACAARRHLAAQTVAGQWVSAIVLGAVSAGYAWGQLVWLDLAPFLALDWWPPVATGMALSAALFLWLRQRAGLQLPAATAARLAELQSRIQPHFLFNALNSAIALVRSDPGRAEAVMEDLAELFRAALASSSASQTLGEELALAKRYLEIEKVRFGERMTVRWELDPAAHAALLPVLVLQPLVENAVKHGIEPSETGGEIRIRTRARQGQARIEISNSVPPVPGKAGLGVALRNVRERLILLHDVSLRFEVSRIGSSGFRVRIAVPLTGR